MEKYLPITSFFIKKSSQEKENIFFKFLLKHDKNTDLIYLKKYKNNPSLIYRHSWLTCFEPEKHLDDLVEKLIKGFFKKNKLNIFGYSFKDDSSIKRLKLFFSKDKNEHNIKNSREIGLPVTGACLDKLFKFTSRKNLQKISYLNGKADILFVRHVLEHSWDIKNFLENLKLLISENGLIIFEVPDCKKGLKNGMQTLLWEEHASYFTEESLSIVLNTHGFKVIETHRYPNQIEDSLVFIVKQEKSKNILKFNRDGQFLLEIFKKKFENKKIIIKNKIEDLILSGFKIYIFGAGHHASSFVSINDLNKDISFVIDDNINKHGYYLPGSRVPIVPSDFLKNNEHQIYLFLTTNPENDKKIISIVESINKNIKINSIFNFY